MEFFAIFQRDNKFKNLLSLFWGQKYCIKKFNMLIY